MPKQSSTVRIVQTVIAAVVMSFVAARGAAGQMDYHVKKARQYSDTVSVATLQVPPQAWKHFEKARALALKHSTVEAERETEKALAISPRFAAAHVLQANQQLLLRNYAEAIKNILEALKIDPEIQWAGVVLAGGYNGLHRYEDALTAIESIQGNEATSWQAKYERARAEIGLHDEEAALKLSAETIEQAPKDFPDARLVRANALILAHRWSEAKDCLNGYLALPGKQARRDQVLRALSMIAQKDTGEASLELATR